MVETTTTLTEEKVKEIMLAPPQRKDALQITVKRFFTDVNGTVIDKTDPAIPASMQTQYPVWMFGEFDRQGAYYLALKNFPPEIGYVYLTSFVYAVSNPLFFGFSGINTIQTKLIPGDLVTVFTDSLTAPNIFVWIVQHAPNKPLASFMTNITNLVSEKRNLRSMHFDYYSDNTEQWNEKMQWITYNYMGLVYSNYLEPIIYRTPDTPQNGFVQVKWETIINQYVGLNFHFFFDTDSITLTFQLTINK